MSLEVTSRVASLPVPFRLAQCTVHQVPVAHIDSLEVSSLCPLGFALDFSLFLINFTEKMEKLTPDNAPGNRIKSTLIYAMI